MYKRYLFFVLVVVLGLCLWGLSLVYDRMAPARLELISVKDPVVQEPNDIPDFSVETFDGGTVSLGDLRGKTVILNFWATWCPPCIVEFPILVDITEKYPDKVILLAVSSDGIPGDLERFVKKFEKQSGHRLNPDRVIIARNPGGGIARDKFNVTTYPESFIISPSGENLRHIVGHEDWGNPDVQSLLARLARE